MIAPTYINGADEKTLRHLIKKNLRGKVLDIGCGQARVKNYLASDTTYVGMDANPGPMVDVVGDVHHLPFESDTFNGAICTAVLEHVQDVDQVISEIFRVLKKDGKLIVTIPFIHHYHKDPEDYRRLSHVGLQELLKKHGFRTVTTHMNYGVYTVVEYAFFCVLVHARREKLFQKKWYLLPYYVVILTFFLFFKVINYLTALIQQHDTSMYVGVAAVAEK